MRPRGPRCGERLQARTLGHEGGDVRPPVRILGRRAGCVKGGAGLQSSTRVERLVDHRAAAVLRPLEAPADRMSLLHASPSLESHCVYSSSPTRTSVPVAHTQMETSGATMKFLRRTEEFHGWSRAPTNGVDHAMLFCRPLRGLRGLVSIRSSWRWRARLFPAARSAGWSRTRGAGGHARPLRGPVAAGAAPGCWGARHEGRSRSPRSGRQTIAAGASPRIPERIRNRARGAGVRATSPASPTA